MQEERRPAGIGWMGVGGVLLLLVVIGSTIALMGAQPARPGQNEQRGQSPTPATSQELPLRQHAPTPTLRFVTRPTTTSPAPGYAVSAEEAGTIALDAAPGSRLRQTPGLVNFEGTIAYEVLLNQGVVYVDAERGDILYSSVTVLAETPTLQERISRERAIAIAVEYAGGGSVYEASLEDEHGHLVYEVEFTNDGTVYVDATTGEVVWARLNAPDDPEHDDRIRPRPDPHPEPSPGTRERPNPEPPAHEDRHEGDDDDDDHDDDDDDHDDDDDDDD